MPWLIDGTNYYAYDGEGRLCAVQTYPYGGGTLAYGYLYDAEGRRVAKGTITPGPVGQSPSCNPATNGFILTESYVLGQGGEQLTTTTWNGQTGVWARTNVYGEGKLLATYDPLGLHFHLADPLGTRRLQTNAEGVPELDCQSLPFGDQQNCFPDPNAEDAGEDSSPLHFTGKERDAESGNDYFNARYFGSSMGRFLSPDPLGGQLVNPQTLNRYAYGLNNPLRFTDPTGMYVCATGQDCSKFEKVLAGLRGSKDADVARAAAAYGALGKDNGVTVGFKDLSKGGENGTTVSTVGVDANGNLRANSAVTINSKISGDDYAAAVGHEGSHVADAQDVVSSGLSNGDNTIHAGMNITPYQSEVRAWGVTNSILKSGNQTEAFDCGATTCKLGASPAIGKDGILPSQIPGAIDQILANSEVYRREAGGQPMGPNNQGASVVNGVTPTPPAASVPH